MSLAEATPIVVGAWNIKDAFSDPDRAGAIINDLTERGGGVSVAVLSEAYDPRREDLLEDVCRTFDSRGYTAIDVRQEVPEYGLHQKDPHGLMVVARQEFVRRTQRIQLASRYAIQVTLHDASSGREYDLLGYHGQDISEKLRIEMVRALLGHVATEGGRIAKPTILAGDANVMPRNLPVAPVLRAAHPFTYLFPYRAPDPEHPPKTPAEIFLRMVSLGRRVTDMARGTSLEMLEAAGFGDTNEHNIPTMSERGLAIPIDRIMRSPHFHCVSFEVSDRNAAEEYGVYKPAADHRQIRAGLLLVA